MIKFYHYGTNNERAEYLFKLLDLYCQRYKLPMADDIQQADVILVSAIDPMEFAKIRRLRKDFPNKTIIMGGAQSFLYNLYENYVDFVCVGEGEDLFRFLSRCKRIEDIKDLPYIHYKGKKEQVVPNRNIYWEGVPLIQTTRNVFYLWVGNGCPRKCEFCYIAHIKTFNQCDINLVKRKLNLLPKGKRAILIQNYNTYKFEEKYLKKILVSDTYIQSYTKEPERFKYIQKVRLGIEFFTPEIQKRMRKVIPIEKVREAIDIATRYKQELQLFYIIGLEPEEVILQYLDELLDIDLHFTPRIIFKFTYIDFSSITPIANGDVRQVREINPDRILKFCLSKNRRARIISRRRYNPFRTLIQRCKTLEEAEFVFSLRNTTDKEVFISEVEKEYPHLLGNEIITPNVESEKKEMELCVNCV
jgi:hypothetical protein